MSHVKPWQICAIAAFTLAALVPAVTTASAGSINDLIKERLYGNPDDTSTRKPPDGYNLFFIETVGRHGARALVNDDPEQAALGLWNAAEEKGALTDTGESLARDIKTFQAAEREIGYGRLSGLGKEEMKGIGRRTADNYSSFFRWIKSRDKDIATVTTEVTRTEQSAGWLRAGLESGLDSELDGQFATPVEADETMRFSNEATSAGQAMVDKVRNRASLRERSKHVLGTSYKASFVDSLDDPVSAALTLYKLYITAPSMKRETDVRFGRYVPEEDRDALSYYSDVETYYQWGPGVKGETNTFSKARPLLDAFFDRLDRRIEGSPTAAVFRIGHGETIMPFAALIKAPLSHVQTPKGDVFSRITNPWRSAIAGRLSGNIEWTAFRNKAGEVLVTMRYNEVQAQFHSGCTPYKPTSYFYRVEELKDCLR